MLKNEWKFSPFSFIRYLIFWYSYADEVKLSFNIIQKLILIKVQLIIIFSI